MRRFEYDDELMQKLMNAMRGTVGIQRDRTQPIQHLLPHYSDDRFREMQTVYLAPDCKLNGDTVEGASYDYSDRIQSWDYEKARKAWDEAKTQHGNHNTAAMLETYLRLFFDKPKLELVHIIAGVNHSNGHPYQLFGYFADGRP